MAGPYGNFVSDNNTADEAPVRRQQGVFALNPLATPKYARNRGVRDAEFRDTLARIYVSLADADDATKRAYLASLPGDAQVQALAQVLLGSGSQGGSGFVDFILSQVQESFQEALQVDKVLGDTYVAFYFGQQPPVFQYSGFLLNSMQDDQRSGFALAYQNLLRGTALAGRGALARLRYDSVIVSGTMNGHGQVLDAANEMAVPFNFTFLVKEYVVLQNPLFTRRSPADFVKLATDLAVASLSPVGGVSDARVRTTFVVPPSLAASSAAGADEPDQPIDVLQNPLQQLMTSVAAAGATASATANILGTVSPVPPSPAAPFAGGL